MVSLRGREAAMSAALGGGGGGTAVGGFAVGGFATVVGVPPPQAESSMLIARTTDKTKEMRFIFILLMGERIIYAGNLFWMAGFPGWRPVSKPDIRRQFWDIGKSFSIYFPLHLLAD
jgi:hypothetical protein